MNKTVFFTITFCLLLCICSCDKDKNKKHTYEIIKNAVTDIDGNHYDAVKIGDQTWMMQNLKTTRYADGTEIPLSMDPTVYEDFNWPSDGPYRWAPNDDILNMGKFGGLYNWQAVMHSGSGSDRNPSGVQGICPDGWHVPSDAEWTELTDYVSSDRKMHSYNADYAIAKALAAQTDWEPGSDKGDVGYDLSKNNATGFSALPAGIAGYPFVTFGKRGYYWTATYAGYDKAYCRSFHSENEDVNKDSWLTENGLSVRCVKD